MLSVIEPDGAENFSIGQIIQVRELKISRSDNRRRLDVTRYSFKSQIFPWQELLKLGLHYLHSARIEIVSITYSP